MSPYDANPSHGLNAAVADTLNGERVASGLTFDQLAEATGISKRTLMRLLSKKERHIDVSVLSALAEAFHMSPTQVIRQARERMSRAADDDVTPPTPLRGRTYPSIQQQAARDEEE